MKTKKLICIMLIFITAFTICSCTADKNEVISPSTDNTSVTTKTEAESTNKTISTSTEETTTKKAKVKVTVAEDSTKKKVVKNTATEKKKTATSSTSAVITTFPAQYCTINIECKSVLDNMEKLKAGHTLYVPENGYILKSYQCNYNDGITAYDVLKKACSDNDIKLTAKGSGYGIYVSGINNLDEFDCGSESGWLYLVNGKKHPVSCDKYTLSSGDEITFTYTCEY